jgi:hypothetical protein
MLAYAYSPMVPVRKGPFGRYVLMMTPEDTAFVLTSASSRGGVPSAGLFRCSVRIRVEKKFAHFAGHIAGDRSLLRPCKCLIQIGACQNSKTAHVLLSLGVRSVCDEHSAVGLLPHRLRVGGRGDAAGELPGAGCNQFAVERVDLLHGKGYHHAQANN